MPHRFVLWSRALLSKSRIPIPTPVLTSLITARTTKPPRTIESRSTRETAHDQANPPSSAFKQAWADEVAQLKRVTFYNTVASLAIFFLATMLTILWNVDPNPCAFDSGFFYAQNGICIVLGILLIERYLNAIGVPDVLRWLMTVFFTGSVYLGHWHMRVKTCRGR